MSWNADGTKIALICTLQNLQSFFFPLMTQHFSPNISMYGCTSDIVCFLIKILHYRRDLQKCAKIFAQIMPTNFINVLYRLCHCVKAAAFTYKFVKTSIREYGARSRHDDCSCLSLYEQHTKLPTRVPNSCLGSQGSNEGPMPTILLCLQHPA